MRYVASQDVPAGTQISASSNNTVAFSNGRMFRKFVWGVGHEYRSRRENDEGRDDEREQRQQDDGGRAPMACYLLGSARVANLEQRRRDGSRGGGPAIVLDLDNPVPVAGRHEAGGNVECEGEPCQWTYVAKRDIQKGEELMLDRERKTEDDESVPWELVGL